jgi:protease I
MVQGAEIHAKLRLSKKSSYFILIYLYLHLFKKLKKGSMHMKASKKILIITGDAGESFEIHFASHRLREEGYFPVIAAPSVRRLNLVMHDFEPGWDTYIERKGYLVESEISFTDVNAEDYEAVLIPGGRAPEYLRNDTAVIKIVKEFWKSGKYIFAICHGVQILVTAGLVNQKKIACYEHVKFEVESCGGIYVTPDEAVKDGRIVTGKTWQSHPEFYRIVFSCLQAVDKKTENTEAFVALS